MREIGGYFELDRYSLPLLHDGALGLNSGRGCIEYLIRQREIKKLALPWFLCSVVKDSCLKLGCELSFYEVGADFMPINPSVDKDEWLYVVNFYGQLSHEQLSLLRSMYPLMIVDNAQAYFSEPLPDTDTLYTCRKFFGVADGAFLYTGAPSMELEKDESFERMRFVLGRFERGASEFYSLSAENNDLFDNEGPKAMSALTENLLRGIDYAAAAAIRRENFDILQNELGALNTLPVRNNEGPYMYPFMTDRAQEIRAELISRKIFIPKLWPGVSGFAPAGSSAEMLAENILPLPVDQRYDWEDMLYVAENIKSLLNL